MDKPIYAVLPGTSDMLDRVKCPREKTLADRIENALFFFMVGLFAASLVVAGLAVTGWISTAAARAAVLVFSILVLAAFLIWSVSQMVTAAAAIKGGFRRVAERIDREIRFESGIIADLQGCDPAELRKRAAHLDLKIRQMTRRAGISTVLTAIGVVILNLRDAAQASWGRLEDVTLFVYAGSLGVLIGAALLITLAGQLEKVSGLFVLAAGGSTHSR